MDRLAFAEEVIVTMSNSPSENPIVSPRLGVAHHGAFHAAYLVQSLDSLVLADERDGGIPDMHDRDLTSDLLLAEELVDALPAHVGPLGPLEGRLLLGSLPGYLLARLLLPGDEVHDGVLGAQRRDRLLQGLHLALRLDEAGLRAPRAGLVLGDQTLELTLGQVCLGETLGHRGGELGVLGSTHAEQVAVGRCRGRTVGSVLAA